MVLFKYQFIFKGVVNGIEKQNIISLGKVYVLPFESVLFSFVCFLICLFVNTCPCHRASKTTFVNHLWPKYKELTKGQASAESPHPCRCPVMLYVTLVVCNLQILWTNHFSDFKAREKNMTKHECHCQLASLL